MKGQRYESPDPLGRLEIYPLRSRRGPMQHEAPGTVSVVLQGTMSTGVRIYIIWSITCTGPH